MYYLLRQRSARQLLLDQTWKGATVISTSGAAGSHTTGHFPFSGLQPPRLPSLPPTLQGTATLFSLVLLWPELQTVCFQQNAPAQPSSWETWSAWVVNNDMICWGAPNDYQQSRSLSWDTAEEDGRACSFWTLQRTEVPVQIGRWGFNYSFQSKFTSTMCHDEKDRKLNQKSQFAN